MYDTYRTNYTVRPRLGSVERKGTPITEEQLAELWEAEVASHKQKLAQATMSTASKETLSRKARLARANDARMQQRAANEARILELLREGPKSTPELTKATGLSAGRVKTAIYSLRDAGQTILNRQKGVARWFELEATL